MNYEIMEADNLINSSRCRDFYPVVVSAASFFEYIRYHSLLKTKVSLVQREMFAGAFLSWGNGTRFLYSTIYIYRLYPFG